MDFITICECTFYAVKKDHTWVCGQCHSIWLVNYVGTCQCQGKIFESTKIAINPSVFASQIRARFQERHDGSLNPNSNTILLTKIRCEKCGVEHANP